MDDLFEQLKAAPPVNKNIIPKYSSSGDQSPLLPEDNGNSPSETESMPPPNAPLMNPKQDKSPILSPKSDSCSIQTKPFKVLIARKKFCIPKNGSIKRKSIDHKEPPEIKKAAKSVTKNEEVIKQDAENDTALKDLFKSPENLNKSDPKTTPTKAQQKDFSPIIPSEQSKSEVQKPVQLFVTKRCLVRLARQNYKKSPNQLTNPPDSEEISPNPIKCEDTPKQKSPEAKRSPTAKRSRSSTSPTKPQTSFYIKLDTSPSKLQVQKNSGKKSEKSAPRCKGPKSKAQKKSSTVSLIKNFKAGPSSRTKATKFTRTELIKSWGKRVFQWHVRIERCRHPLMVIFDSNAQASKEQSKLNKSKKLSVSFREQVEIFGSTDTDEQSDDDNEKCTPKVSNFKKSDTDETSSNENEVATKPIATPASLKKVENGKVVGEIEFDSSLFIDQDEVSALDSALVKSSTPRIHSPLSHKRKEKKSFSPLKSDATPSPRKEKLKLANEKLPPTGLRRLNIDEIDEDDDDDCEYIVPTELPERRTSRINSGNVTESSSSFKSATDETEVKTVKSSYTNDVSHPVEAPTTPEKRSVNEGFTGNIEEADAEKQTNNCIDIADSDLEILPKLMRIESSPVLITTSPDLSPVPCSKEGESEGDGVSTKNNPDDGKEKMEEESGDTTNNNVSEHNASKGPSQATVTKDQTKEDDCSENILKGRVDEVSNDFGVTANGEENTTLKSSKEAETCKSDTNTS